MLKFIVSISLAIIGFPSLSYCQIQVDSRAKPYHVYREDKKGWEETDSVFYNVHAIIRICPTHPPGRIRNYDSLSYETVNDTTITQVIWDRAFLRPHTDINMAFSDIAEDIGVKLPKSANNNYDIEPHDKPTYVFRLHDSINPTYCGAVGIVRLRVKSDEKGQFVSGGGLIKAVHPFRAEIVQRLSKASSTVNTIPAGLRIDHSTTATITHSDD